MERIGELMKQMLDEREEGSDKWPKTEQVLFRSHALEAELYKKLKDVQAFWIVETDDSMHLINYRMHYAPYMDFRFIPITSVSKSFETWMGMDR